MGGLLGAAGKEYKEMFKENHWLYLRDYLLSLREYSVDKNRSSQPSLMKKKGDIVILKDEHTARGW